MGGQLEDFGEQSIKLIDIVYVTNLIYNLVITF